MPIKKLYVFICLCFLFLDCTKILEDTFREFLKIARTLSYKKSQVYFV